MRAHGEYNYRSQNRIFSKQKYSPHRPIPRTVAAKCVLTIRTTGASLKGMTNYRIELHRTMSDHVCTKDRNFKNEAKKHWNYSFRANKPPGVQLAHYKLGRHKSNINNNNVRLL